MNRHTFALLGMLSVPTLALADDRTPRQVVVPVGASAPLHLAAFAPNNVCNDPSVVRIDVDGEKKGLQAVGLKAGRTLCSFSDNPKGQRIVLEIVVTEPVAPAPVPASAN